MPQMELISRKRCGNTEKDLKCGTWNVQTLFKTTALVSLLFQLKKYRPSITALQETRLQQEGCNGYYITYTLIINKNEPENLGWHL
jgi:exonuclease III